MRYRPDDTSIAVARSGRMILRQPKTASRVPRRCVRSTVMSEILGLPREALDRARRSRDPRQMLIISRKILMRLEQATIQIALVVAHPDDAHVQMILRFGGLGGE